MKLDTRIPPKSSAFASAGRVQERSSAAAGGEVAQEPRARWAYSASDCFDMRGSAPRGGVSLDSGATGVGRGALASGSARGLSGAGQSSGKAPAQGAAQGATAPKGLDGLGEAEGRGAPSGGKAPATGGATAAGESSKVLPGERPLEEGAKYAGGSAPAAHGWAF